MRLKMPMDAAILVESTKDGGRRAEYIIFVTGGEFENSSLLIKNLEEFCNKNDKGWEMSYQTGITPEELEGNMLDRYPRVNILFARNIEELKKLEGQFGVINAEFDLPPEIAPLPIEDASFRETDDEEQLPFNSLYDNSFSHHTKTSFISMVSNLVIIIFCCSILAVGLITFALWKIFSNCYRLVLDKLFVAK